MAGESGVLILLRHALAGVKLADPGLDLVRGLDPSGEATAHVVSDLILEHVRPALLLSSPFVRCVDTLRPIAEAVGLPIRTRHGLTPTTPPGACERLLLSATDGAVVCTHGEVITRVFEGLDCEKGAFWVIHREHGRLHPAAYVEAPAVPTPSEVPFIAVGAP
jgi:phosphohistidine phosphatase SixA